MRETAHEFLVEKEAAGERLDRYLADKLKLTGVSRSRIAAAVRDGRITLDGASCPPSRRLKGGELLTVEPEALADPTISSLDPYTPREPGELGPVSILYQDAELIVVDKPAGLVVHPAHGHPADTLLNVLAGMGVELAPAAARPGVVHRLDMDTSGILVLAKSSSARLALVRQFSARTVERAYLALTYGVPAPGEGSLDWPIGRHPRDRKRFAVRPDGRRAVTHYQVLRELPPSPNPWAALVECRLETGRTHQVRVHLAHLGYPLLGDQVYGSRRSRQASSGLPLKGQALHARLLAFDHPSSGERLTFTSEPPPAFAETLELLTEWRQ